MALKKPSDFFNEKPNKSVEAPEEVGEHLPESFNAYKSNIKNIEVLNDFVDSFGTLKENIQKVNTLEDTISSLKEELQEYTTKEDLDNAVMSNLLVLEKNIQKIEFNLKGINRKDLNRIEEEIEDISNKVLHALEEEFPKYKKSLKSNEIFIKDKFYEYSSEVDEKLNQFEDFIQNSFKNIEENLQSINESQLLDVTHAVLNTAEDIESQNQVIEELASKTKKQIFGVEKDLKEFYQKIQSAVETYYQTQNNKIISLEESISSFSEDEVQKYKKLLQETRIQNDQKIQEFETQLTKKYSELSQSVGSLLEVVENKSVALEETVQNKLIDLETSISNSRSVLEETSNDYKKIIKNIEAKGLSDQQKQEEHEKEFLKISSLIENLENNLQLIQEDYSRKEDQEQEIENLKNQFIKKLNLLENDIAFKESNLKKTNQKITETVDEISNQFKDIDIQDLKHSYSNLTNKISYIEEIFSKFNEKTILSEGLLNEPPETKNGDPLTPLNQKFVTLDQLQDHYRLFLNRIQQQLSTLGGGGETRLEFLDDVDRNSAKTDGYVLAYQSSTGKFIGTSSSNADYANVAGIATVAQGLTGTPNINVGVITASDAIFSGNVSISGITTLGSNNGIGTVTIGVGSTALYVDGSARIIGILTVGRSSVTIDGDNNTITSGIVTITNSQIILGENVTINATATGINSAPNVLYVAKDGNDSHNGTSIDNAKLTIEAAVAIAQTGTTIKVLSGTYTENNPITLPEQVSIVGDSLREVSITPQNSGDVFYVTNGNYIANLSFVGAANTGAMVAFSPSGAGNITQSPYVQNCTNFIQNSVGVRINGAHASGNTKSIVVDSYTQYNQGGIGVSITNEGYGQLVSLFTICNDIAIYCGSGGACDLTNSNSSFGNYGLVADGVGSQQYVGTITTAVDANSSTFTISGIETNRPYDGQVVYFDDLYYEISKITIIDGGSNYTTAPTILIGDPSTSWGIAAQAVATITNGTVTEIDIISAGRGYTTTPNITISGGGGSGLSLSLEITPKYYLIQSATLPSNGISTITTTENVPYAIGIGSTVPIFKQSRILASGHSFEYIGSGVTIANALPSTGGVAIQANEIDMRNGGLVVYTSTDQSGNFRIGDGVVINQNTGSISGAAYVRSLYANVTPLILALGGQ